MNTHWAVTLPLVFIVYFLSAAGCAVWAIRRKTDGILWSLSGLIFSIALLNAYVEEWPTLKRLRFEHAAPVLIVLFLLPYRALSLRLVERTGLQSLLMKEMYSFLVLVYAGLIAMMALSPIFARDENPPFVLFTFVVFVCALHVPMFAAGRSKVAKFVASRKVVVPEAPPDISWRFFTTAMAILAIPLVLTLIFRAVLHDDYRLFAVNGVLTAIIFSFLAISRRGQFREHVSEEAGGELSARRNDF